MEDINAKLQTIFSYENPWCYLMLIAIFGCNMVLDKYSNKSYFQKNGFLLAFNMVIYFGLLHTVYTFSVKNKPADMIDSIEKAGKMTNLEIEIKDPVVQSYQKSPEELEKLYKIFMSGLVFIFFVYLVSIKIGWYKWNKSETKYLTIGCVLILLTICSELFLVFHVFDNPVIPLCKAILKSITSPEL